MNRFDYLKTAIAGVYEIKAKPIADECGYFERYFCAEEFKELGITVPFVQIKHSYTVGLGTVRGVHFQLPPFNEIKLVRCLKGRVLDVAVDLRKGSPTFLKYVGAELSEQEHNYLLLPNGTGHAFQALTEETELLYLVSAPYAPEHESGINPLDPQVGIKWPIKMAKMSKKDQNREFITSSFCGLEI